MSLDLLWQKTMLPVLMILLLLVIIDFNTRLTITSENENDDWQSLVKQLPISKRLSVEDARQIEEKLQAYEVDTIVQENVSTEQSMSAKQQAEQKGDLSQLYIGDLRYRLIGVFSQRGVFAVLQSSNVKTGEQKMVKVMQDSVLENYSVQQISEKSVMIRAQEGREINLYLFKKRE